MEVKIDLNSEPAKPMLPRLQRKEMANECWQIDLLTTDGLSSGTRVSPMRRTLPRRLQAQELLLLGSVSLHGLCPINISRKPARYRSLPASSAKQALSHGHPRSCLAQHPGERKLSSRLAYLFRLRSSAHHPSPRPLPPRRLHPGVAANGLRPRCHHHRLMPFVISLGQVSQAKRSGETPYFARPAWQHSYGNHHYSRPDSRSQHARGANLRGRCVLSDGPSLSRFSSATPTAFVLGVLCHAGTQKIRLPAALLFAGRPHYGDHVRS